MHGTPAVAKRAVVIDDDPDVRHLLVTILESAGFDTTAASDGVDGVAAVRDIDPVVTTLDVTMPGIDGYETARRIREISDGYIVIVTALDDEADAVLGFAAGADDVVVKPFRPREFRARIDAMLRRPRTNASAAVRSSTASGDAGIPTTPSERTIVLDDLVVDLASRTVRLSGADLSVTRSEFELLATLLSSGRRVRSRADLVLTLRGEDPLDGGYVSEADERAIETHMANLRRKLGDSAAEPRYLETVRGIGYRARRGDG